MACPPAKKPKCEGAEKQRLDSELFELALSNGKCVQIKPQEMLPKMPFSRGRSDMIWTGGNVWYASEMLARLISAEPGRVCGKRVLDLGTGCGLLGIVAGALGASTVTLTDEVLYLASHNVDCNFQDQPDLHQNISVQQLSWGNKKHIAAVGPPYDVILLSDLLYCEMKHECLANTIIALSAAGACVLCATPDGMPWDRHSKCFGFYSLLEERGFKMGQVSDERVASLESGTGCDRGLIKIAEMYNMGCAGNPGSVEEDAAFAFGKKSMQNYREPENIHTAAWARC